MQNFFPFPISSLTFQATSRVPYWHLALNRNNDLRNGKLAVCRSAGRFSHSPSDRSPVGWAACGLHRARVPEEDSFPFIVGYEGLSSARDRRSPRDHDGLVMPTGATVLCRKNCCSVRTSVESELKTSNCRTRCHRGWDVDGEKS